MLAELISAGRAGIEGELITRDPALTYDATQMLAYMTEAELDQTLAWAMSLSEQDRAKIIFHEHPGKGAYGRGGEWTRLVSLYIADDAPELQNDFEHCVGAAMRGARTAR